MNQRPGIPEEARRAARVRSTAAVPAGSGTNGVPSPIKRVNTTAATPSGTGNAFAQQQVSATPAPKERTRPLPETPQTAVRSGVSVAQPTLGSPSKRVQTSDHIRKTSTVHGPTATKRASQGVPVNGAAPAAVGTTQQQRVASGTAAAANLAAMAAREANANASANANANASTRWRS